MSAGAVQPSRHTGCVLAPVMPSSITPGPQAGVPVRELVPGVRGRAGLSGTDAAWDVVGSGKHTGWRSKELDRSVYVAGSEPN